MRAITLHRHGDASVLQLETLPDPAPGPGQALVRVHACALNRLDVWVRGGLPNLRLAYPHVLGSDIAGDIVEVGAGVDRALVGRDTLVNPGLSCGLCEACLSGWDNLCARYRIIGENAPGGYCELIAVPIANLVAKPAGLDMIHAAAIPLTFLTAWQMLVVRARVGAGDTVLVHAVGSGVGVAALQIARLHGARVVALARSEDKLTRARELGADATVSTADASWPEQVRALPWVGKRGLDIVVEHVGKDTWDASLRLTRKGGVIVTCGASSGWDASTDLRQVFFRQLQILGSTMGSKSLLHRMVPLFERGVLQPIVDRSFALAEAAAAHRHLEARGQFGKVVLAMSPSLP
jgi:NADPH:quinone reductase-like Zn-dependent oxidoreductase